MNPPSQVVGSCPSDSKASGAVRTRAAERQQMKRNAGHSTAGLSQGDVKVGKDAVNDAISMEAPAIP